MSKRLMALLAVLLGIGLLMAFDDQVPAAMVEVAEPAPRAPPRRQEAAPQLMTQASFDAAEPVPDLFAGGAGPAAAAAESGATPRAEPEEAPAAPFRLLGFKDEDGVREAFLQGASGEVVMARSGAVLDKRYRVLALRQEAVHLHDKQTGAEHRIGFEVDE